MSLRKHGFLNKALIVVLALWGLSCIVPEFARVVNDYATLGFEANNAGLVTLVDGSPALEAGIQPGDCIDLKRTSLPDLLAVFAGMGGMTLVRPGTEVTLSMAKHCNAGASSSERVSLEAKVQESSYPHRLMLIVTGILGILSIILGAALAWQRPNAMTWGFFSYVIWFNPGLTLVFYAELQRFPHLVLVQEFLQAAAQAAGYTGFITFALRFPRNVVDPRWRWLETLLPVLAVLFFFMHLATFGTALGFSVEGISQLSYVVVYIVPITVWLILYSRQKQQAPTDRQRTRWVDWACRIGLLPFIFADSNMSTSLWDGLVGPMCSKDSALSAMICEHGRLSESMLLALLALNAVIPAAVYHAVLKHRVIDVRFALSRGLTLLVTSVLLAYVLSEAAIEAEKYLKDSINSQILVCACLVPIIKFSFEYIHDKLNEVCDHLFFRRLHVAEHAVQAAGNRLHLAESFDAIDQQLMQVPLTSLELSSAAVFRLERGGEYRPKIEPVGWRGSRHARCPLEGPKLRQLQQSGGALRLHESDTPKAHDSDAAEPVLAIPVVAADALVAVVLYGAHKSGEDISADEQRIIEGLIEPAGGAYAGVEVSMLRRKIDKLSEELRN